MNETARTYFIWTIGCQMNDADSHRLATQLEAGGMVSAATAETADLIVLNTCVVRQQAEDKIYGRLNSLNSSRKRRQGQVVCLMGCLVGIRDNPELQRRFPFVDVFLAPSATGPLLEFLAARHWLTLPAATGLEEYLADYDLPLPRAEQGRQVMAYVPVVLGCSHACTFCVIPSRRGGERSRPAAEILTEIRGLAAQGIKEVMLLGQIVDRYGHDLGDGMTLARLLREVHSIDGLKRIRFLTSHPGYITDELLDTVAALPGICPHLEVPIQAGNDRVLKRMRRGYTVSQFRLLVDRIRTRLPEAAINTDVIVGFCGETEAEFEDTYRQIAEIRFDKVHIARYSTRPGTPAARRFTDDVPEVEKERRRAALDDLQRQILEEKNREWLGRDVEVLVEDRQKGRWRGRTPQNRLVFLEDDRDLSGRLLPVHIDVSGPYSLIGTAADVRDPELATNS